MYQTIHFLNAQVSLINLSLLSTKSDDFVNLTPTRKVIDLYPIFPFSWQQNVVWISCNWLFNSLWLEEELEIYFNLIGVFLSFIPILPLTLDFMINMVFKKKMPGMFIWKFGPSSVFWSKNFQILMKWERVYRIPYTTRFVGCLCTVQGASSLIFRFCNHFISNINEKISGQILGMKVNKL